MSLPPNALVNMDDAKRQLYLDPDSSPNDAQVELLIGAASEAVMSYIKSGGVTFLDSSGNVPVDFSGDPLGVPYVIKQATLYLIGVMFRDRDGENADKWEQGYLPRPVTSLLYPYRLPTLA